MNNYTDNNYLTHSILNSVIIDRGVLASILLTASSGGQCNSEGGSPSPGQRWTHLGDQGTSRGPRVGLHIPLTDWKGLQTAQHGTGAMRRQFP